ncbi:MAG: prephenate dehydratase [bacterium]
MSKKIAFQGEKGANSEVACQLYASEYDSLPCATFEDMFAAVKAGEAELAMVPVENSLAGRVSDIHHLLPQTGLSIIAEHFMPVHHQLMTVKGVAPEELKIIRSHAMALGQCREVIKRRNLTAQVAGDTAGAARQLAQRGDRHCAVLAPALAAELYDLEIIEHDVEDAGHNTTRFLTMARHPLPIEKLSGRTMTTIVFQVRNIPAALYKAMGGFATNGVNMTKLESYMSGGAFTATMFYADIEGHPGQSCVDLALDELQFFCTQYKLLGAYPADPFRFNE